jgi:SAM-dependent methyltransferase
MKRRDKFSRTLRSNPRKTDSHPSAQNAKAQIRRNVLQEIGPGTASVFDAFCGAGQMYRAVWKEAARYIGCDRKWYRDERMMFVADSRRVMRAIDLSPFSVFDFDAYGAPWEWALILAARRRVQPEERIGLVLTEGSGLKVKLGTLPIALSIASGMKMHLVGGSAAFDQIVNRAVEGIARRMHCRIVKRWEAKGKVGSSMRYIGLVLEGEGSRTAQDIRA